MAEQQFDVMILGARHGTAAAMLAPGVTAIAAGSDPRIESALQDLYRLGFVDRAPDERWRWRGADDDRRLLALLSTFALRLQVGRLLGETVCIAAALWEPQHGAADGGRPAGDVFSGTGFKPDDAIRSCLGEFAEFQSWLFRPGDAVRRCRGSELGAQAIDPWSILGFSAQQRDHWQAFNEAWQGYDSIPDPTAFVGDIDWSSVRPAGDGLQSWLPSQVCFGRYGYRIRRSGNIWRSDSNGCAAGATPEGARLAALLELVERDATGIWWYGRCPRPQLDLSGLEHADLDAAITARRRQGQHIGLLDLTHDLGVPVVAAILLDAGGTLLASGFGCKTIIGHAAASAYLEMCQMEMSVALVKQREARAPDGAATAEDRRLLRWLSDANVRRLPQLVPADAASVPRSPIAGNLEPTFGAIVERLSQARLSAYLVDLQRPDIGIPAVRMFVPGLCHFKPRLGHSRLVEVPKALAWQEPAFAAIDLNQSPLLI